MVIEAGSGLGLYLVSLVYYTVWPNQLCTFVRQTG